MKLYRVRSQNEEIDLERASYIVSKLSTYLNKSKENMDHLESRETKSMVKFFYWICLYNNEIDGNLLNRNTV